MTFRLRRLARLVPRPPVPSRAVLRAATRGNAAVEMAILLPVLVLTLTGAIDFGRAMYAYVTTSSAAHEAALYSGRFFAPTTDVTAGELATIVTTESKGFLVVPTNTSITGPTLATGVTKVPLVQVKVTYTFKPLTLIPFTGNLPITVTASSAMPGQVL